MFFRMFGHGPDVPWYGWVGFVASNLLWIAFIALMVWLVLHIARGTTPTNTLQPQPTVSAMEILRMRYARGEIDTATFEQMRQQLLATDQNPPMQI